MSRDCTAPPMVPRRCTVQFPFAVSHTKGHLLDQAPRAHQMKKVSRADARIDQLVQNKTLTPDGRDWLVTALDPFHDLDHQVAGYPDADSSHTVVSTYQYALDITKPATVTTPTWDAHIYSLPFNNASGTELTFKGGVLQANHTYSTLPAVPKNTLLGMVNVWMENSGNALFPYSDATLGSATASRAGVLLNSQFDGTVTRVIGMAMEVVDTTADIYKQGSLTVYRLPQNQSPNSNVCYDAESAWLYVRSGEIALNAPPSSAADALKLVGSRQWAARDGCYALVTQSTVTNPLKPNQGAFIRIDKGAKTSATAYSMMNTGTKNGHLVGAPPVAAMISPEYSVQLTPMNTTGIMLCGLNENASFRLKVKMIVETAPAPWQSDLVVLASPSAPYDPVALEAYSKALACLPVGVPASENGLGDWFSGLADIVSKIALPVSTALSPIFPMAPVIGGALSTISGVMKNSMAGQKKNDALYPKNGRLTDASSSLRDAQKTKPKKQTGLTRKYPKPIRAGGKAK